ncbi:MAG: cysteine--tRNA ligase [Planctomycetes bacterium]|nr:cysteine--tRNA ligase [Planctomycetota bacterium]
MPITFYNTYTKREEEFLPLEPGKVRMYNCGPTVYSHPHIGNFRSFLFADTLRRYLEYRGFEVLQVMNLTDVGHIRADADAGEDKMEVAARSEKVRPLDIANRYADIFFDLVARLGLRRAMVYPRATDHIPEMIRIVERLVADGFAYAVNGAVYFDITRFPAYGRLSGNTPEQLDAGSRVEIHPDKKNPRDFALWKFDPQHLMQWPSPWSSGFPGWHIECTAMSMKYLGETLDIHTGGEDNIFPHHECEIAQSESYTKKPFVRYWLHARHLLVDGEKMSKSKGNFYTVQQVLDKGFHPRELRYALVSANYREPLNFTFESLESARVALERVSNFRRRLAEARTGAQPAAEGEAARIAATARAAFQAGMDHDLNVSRGLGVVFDFVRDGNRLLDGGAAGPGDVAALLAALDGFLEVFGLAGMLGAEEASAAALAPEDAQLLRDREDARRRKDWKAADELRARLRARGLVVEDGAGGSRWKRVGP